jgi:hypothetical protein
VEVSALSRLPWITLVIALVAALNPIGLEFLRGAFWPGEQLSRNIAQPIVFTAMGILIALGIIETLVKHWLRG